MRILRYVVAEDCGTMVNPLIVEGQVHGGVAQGIGGALYEDLVYDEAGTLVSGSFMDYLIPTAAEIPDVDVCHLESPTPLVPGGFKGMGEGGAVNSPACVLAAVNDALRAARRGGEPHADHAGLRAGGAVGRGVRARALLGGQVFLCRI